jgi:hypothetical protein
VQRLALLGVEVVPAARAHIVKGDELDDLAVGQIGGLVLSLDGQGVQTAFRVG